MKKYVFLFSLLCSISPLFQQTLHAQGASLGIQGILKKANGNAVDDGPYSLRFRLYEQAEGGTHIWEETQPSVDVVGGIYTATLGLLEDLDIPFDTTYYLGVSVGSTSEMSPRIRLTTAPYALSLIGNTNQFPSSGTVEEDNTIIAGKLAVGQMNLPTTPTLQVNGGIVARGGAPAVNGANNNGYAFSGNSGDNDSGLFSIADGQVSLYTNNTERLRAGAAGVEITGNLTSNTATLTVDDNLRLTANKSLQYDGLSDWRLVMRQDFTGDEEGWTCTSALNNSTTAGLSRVQWGTFNGHMLRPSTNVAHVLKRTFNLSSFQPYTHVKVKFKYYYIDSWDADDTGIAGFCTDLGGANANILWMNSAHVYSASSLGNLPGSPDGGYSDGASIGEMVATTTSNSFVMFFTMRSASSDDESYGVGNIEIWVR